MVTFAILDHNAHQLFIEVADESEIESKYNGEIESYIRAMYNYKDDDDHFSWEQLHQPIEVFGEKRNGKVTIHHN